MNNIGNSCAIYDPDHESQLCLQVKFSSKTPYTLFKESLKT